MVSGSSGKLKITKTPTADEARTWPGQIFNDPQLNYEEAMACYATARAERSHRQVQANEQNPAKAQRQQLQHQEQQLRDQRREIRQQRQYDKKAWRSLRQQRREEKAARRALAHAQRRAQHAQREAADKIWQAKRAARRAERDRKKTQDQAWRTERKRLRELLGQLPVVKEWAAILVIVDNCTRKCLGLPMFTAGVHVTAEEVVAALKDLLPLQLHYLIADNGVHFKHKLSALAHSHDFVRVRLSTHRPQSNGIAERFVRTLKGYLLAHVWQNPEQLAPLLPPCSDEYNDRPHQGRELKGLSPNEYARRLVCSTCR
jgi:hypothetical protein